MPLVSIAGPGSRLYRPPEEEQASWPVHSPSFVSVPPGTGGYGMDSYGGGGRNLGTPATTVILVNSFVGGQ